MAIVDSNFGQKHFYFDNYIEFGKFHSELLYNFLYDFDNCKDTIFADKSLYTLVLQKFKRAIKFRVDILPMSKEETTLFFDITSTEVLEPNSLLIKDSTSKGQIFHIGKQGTKDTHTYFINLDFTNLIYEDLNVFRINRQFVDNDILIGFCIKTAKTLFIL